MITKKIFCEQIARRGEKIDCVDQWGRAKNVSRGSLVDSWCIPQVRPFWVLFYGAPATCEYVNEKYPPGYKCPFVIHIDKIEQVNPPHEDQIRFEVRPDGMDKPGFFVEEAPDSAVQMLSKLPYLNRKVSEELKIVDMIIDPETELHPLGVNIKIKNTGTVPLRPVIPVYLDNMLQQSLQPLGNNELDVWNELSTGYSFGWHITGKHTIMATTWGGDRKEIEFGEDLPEDLAFKELDKGFERLIEDISEKYSIKKDVLISHIVHD